MDLNLIFTIVGFIITTVGLYFKQENRISLLEEKVTSNKSSTDESINRLIKSLDKLEISIEKLTDKINEK